MNWQAMRRNMVDGQVKPNNVVDERILEAMDTIPRERFVPTAQQAVAYVDEDVAMAPGRFLLKPHIFGQMVQALAIEAGDTVLDVGCGTGYSAVVLSQLAGTVVATDPDKTVLKQAEALFNTLSADNILTVTAAITAGDKAHGPYQAILLNGAVTHVPETLTDQLAEGGRLVAILQTPGQPGQASLFVRIGSAVSQRPLFNAFAPWLPGLEPVQKFAF